MWSTSSSLKSQIKLVLYFVNCHFGSFIYTAELKVISFGENNKLITTPAQNWSKTAQNILKLTAIISEKTWEKQNHHRNRWTAQGELFSKQSKRNNALWRWRDKAHSVYMHAYHMSQMEASFSSRFMLLDSFYLTVSWTLISNLSLHCDEGYVT